MTKIVLTQEEFSSFASSIEEARQKLIAAGLTPQGVSHYTRDPNPYDDQDEGVSEYEVFVAETKTKEELLAMLPGVSPTPIVVTPTERSIAADGTATASFGVQGRPNCCVRIKWTGMAIVNTRDIDLDASGYGQFVVGPYPAGWMTDERGQSFVLECPEGSSTPVECKVKVG